MFYSVRMKIGSIGLQDAANLYAPAVQYFTVFEGYLGILDCKMTLHSKFYAPVVQCFTVFKGYWGIFDYKMTLHYNCCAPAVQSFTVC